MCILTLFGVVWVAAYRQETKGCRRTWRATILCRWVCKVSPSTWTGAAWSRQRYWRPHRADMKWSWFTPAIFWSCHYFKLESWQSRGQGYPAAWFHSQALHNWIYFSLSCCTPCLLQQHYRNCRTKQRTAAAKAKVGPARPPMLLFSWAFSTGL